MLLKIIKFYLAHFVQIKKIMPKELANLPRVKYFKLMVFNGERFLTPLLSREFSNGQRYLVLSQLEGQDKEFLLASSM